MGIRWVGPSLLFNALGTVYAIMFDGEPSDEEVDEMAGEIVRKSAEMEDYGPLKGIDGECVVCGVDATWQSPSNEYYCQEHASEHFQKRHG